MCMSESFIIRKTPPFKKRGELRHSDETLKRSTGPGGVGVGGRVLGKF